MDAVLKVLLFAFSIFAVVRSELNSTKRIPVKSGNLLLDHNWPHLKTGLTRFPHHSSCYHFYYSSDPEGKFKLRRCPTGLMFDFVTLKCGRETLSQCWSSQFDHGYKPLYHRKHFHCSYPWGRYPDILNCKKYFQCRGKKAHYKTCPNFTLFDKTKSRCVPEALAICSDAAEVEKYYKCPRSRGLFMYSRDCSKYHECRKRIPKLRSCKLGYLFDRASNKCRPKEEVVCGRRYNPYDEATSSGTASQHFTVTQEVHTGKFENTSPSVGMNRSDFLSNLSTNFPYGSFESSDESSSGEHSNLTANSIKNDSSHEIPSGTTDSGFSSSFKELLVKTAGIAQGISSEDSSTRTGKIAHENSSDKFSASITGTAHEVSSQDFSTRSGKITHENSSEKFSTSITGTIHKVSSQDFSTRTAKRAYGSSSADFSKGTAIYPSSSQDFTAGITHVSSSQELSPNIVGKSHDIPSQDFSVRTTEVANNSLSKDPSTETAETTHGSSSHDFSTGTAAYSKGISKHETGNSEEFQTEPFVKLFSIRTSA